jgi:hypothetical protein
MKDRAYDRWSTRKVMRNLELLGKKVIPELEAGGYWVDATVVDWFDLRSTRFRPRCPDGLL